MYFIDNIEIISEIQTDGSLIIEESRTYRFKGSFSWADYSLPLENLGRITDFSLSDNYSKYEESNSSQVSTYQISQSGNKLYVKWFYQARNETRVFTLKYRVEDAVTVHQDVAEFYYKFLAAGRPKTARALNVSLKLPQPADTSHVRAWMHGPLFGEYAFEMGSLHFWSYPLPKKNFLEVRVIFPPAWVPSANVYSNDYKRDQIMAEERILVGRSNRLRREATEKNLFREQNKSKAKDANIILTVLGLAAFILLYKRFGTSHPIPFRSSLTSELPENISPAIANYIYSTGQIGAGAMVATMMDLARKGYLSIEEKIEEKKVLFTTVNKNIYTLKLHREKFNLSKGELAPHELDLVDFLFNQFGEGTSEINLDEIKNSRSKVLKWFTHWKKLVKSQWGDKPIFDKSSVKGTIYCVIISIILIAAGIFTVIRFGQAGLICLISGFMLFGWSFIILRYTKEVKLLRTKLIAFRRYIMKYEFRVNRSDLQSNLEKYFIFGIALGVGQKAIKELIMAVPDYQSRTFFPWYAGAQAHSSPMGLADAISSMVTATSTAMGTAAGVGGGASAGGGGGAGGASGGAG
ncbi:hypothetical protein B6I21_04660 [candidate division KSB1 bacterium 4572_119]|nr:MAG: hypothetical protein B6I21_04660 [candidate division KSB1 bacterium 4572_119]